MSNYFAVEGLILDRLRSSVGDFRLITTGRNLAGVQDHPGPVPAIYLIYDGQKPHMGAGLEQVIDQSWLLVIVVRSVRDLVAGSSERLDAGGLLLQVCEALLGWKPDGEYGPLTLNTAPGPTYDNGFGYYPVRFGTRMILRGK